jgi:phage major head subunit gpT-like protein
MKLVCRIPAPIRGGLANQQSVLQEKPAAQPELAVGVTSQSAAHLGIVQVAARIRSRSAAKREAKLIAVRVTSQFAVNQAICLNAVQLVRPATRLDASRRLVLRQRRAEGFYRLSPMRDSL